MGPEVAHRLRGAIPSRVKLLVDSGSDPASLMESWEGSDLAVVIDAMVSGAMPGTISRFDLSQQPLPAGVRLVSTHALGVTAALELARALGRLPRRLIVYGIEVGTMRGEIGLSPAAGAAVTTVVGMVLEEVSGA